MHEVKLSSLSLFVGTSECNAKCKHCAGIPLRKYASKKDGEVDKELIIKTITKCYEQGARYLSISSSGEPTLSPISVTKTLKLIDETKGINFSPINLYSNGIRIGEDEEFCDEYLPKWKTLGLTTLYITVHNIDEKKNAKAYGVQKYPPLKKVVSRIQQSDLQIRANIVLSQTTISTLEEFIETNNYLMNIGVNKISAWPIRNKEDKIDYKLSPTETELDKIQEWINKTNHDVRLLREYNQEVYKKGLKLTLFPNGVLSNTWCN
ncbi:MAG: radical SAM protein [archaeon]